MISPDWLSLVLTTWIIAATLMGLLWLTYLWKNDPAVVDLGWGASVGLATSSMFFLTPETSIRTLFLLICPLAWSGRLLFLLGKRLKQGRKDPRYEALSAHWKEKLPWRYFLFFQAQALSIPFLILPLALAYTAQALAPTIWDVLALLLFLIGLCGETLSDRQMNRFKQTHQNTGEICQEGCWRYSRHPNYFFDWITWISYAVVGMNHPVGWIGWISPSLLLFSILKITGIPPTEAELLRKKGNTYREYQKTTSAFFPLPPQRNKI